MASNFLKGASGCFAFPKQPRLALRHCPGQHVELCLPLLTRSKAWGCSAAWVWISQEQIDAGPPIQIYSCPARQYQPTYAMLMYLVSGTMGSSIWSEDLREIERLVRVDHTILLLYLPSASAMHAASPAVEERVPHGPTPFCVRIVDLNAGNPSCRLQAAGYKLCRGPSVGRLATTSSVLFRISELGIAE